MGPSASPTFVFLALGGFLAVSGFGFREARLPVCEVEGELLAHEDCTKYYVCSNEVPIASDCPGGLFFNPGLDPPNCDFAFNVTDCIGGTRDPEPGTGPTEPEPIDTTTLPPTAGPTTDEPATELTTQAPVDPTTEPEPITTEQPLPSSTVSSGLCPPDGIDYVPYPGNCSLYYLCVDGEETKMQCADGLLFDEELKKCNLAEEVTCKIDTTEPPVTTTEVPPPTTTSLPPTTEDPGEVNCPATGVDYLPHPTDCQKYYLCVEGTGLEQVCADGLLFDPELKKCNLAGEVTCNIAPQCPAEGISYLPVPGTCTAYIMCVAGEDFPMECAAGTEFSPEESKCVLDETYDCPFVTTSFFS